MCVLMFVLSCLSPNSEAIVGVVDDYWFGTALEKHDKHLERFRDSTSWSAATGIKKTHKLQTYSMLIVQSSITVKHALMKRSFGGRNQSDSSCDPVGISCMYNIHCISCISFHVSAISCHPNSTNTMSARFDNYPIWMYYIKGWWVYVISTFCCISIAIFLFEIITRLQFQIFFESASCCW